MGALLRILETLIGDLLERLRSHPNQDNDPPQPAPPPVGGTTHAGPGDGSPEPMGHPHYGEGGAWGPAQYGGGYSYHYPSEYGGGYPASGYGGGGGEPHQGSGDPPDPPHHIDPGYFGPSDDPGSPGSPPNLLHPDHPMFTGSPATPSEIAAIVGQASNPVTPPHATPHNPHDPQPPHDIPKEPPPHNTSHEPPDSPTNPHFHPPGPPHEIKDPGTQNPLDPGHDDAFGHDPGKGDSPLPSHGADHGDGHEVLRWDLTDL